MPINSLLIIASVLLLSSCSALTDNRFIGGEDAVLRDRAQDYEGSEVAKALVIPSHLDSDKVKDLLIVPDIGIAATTSDKDFEIPRPDFFLAEAGNDKVNLARAGQERLIIVNEPLPRVWDKLQTFWRSNNQTIVLNDPEQGLMETAWINSGEAAPGFFSRLVANLTFNKVEGPAHDKLRLYLKPVEGAADKTSIRLRHLRAAITDTGQAADWSADSQQVGYKSQMMYEILHYLSHSTEESTASAVRERQNQRGRIYFGRSSQGEPVLKLAVSVDEAWDRIQQGLIQAQVNVGSADKNLGKYYITYSSLVPVDNQKPVGFFGWLHGKDDDITFDTGALGSELTAQADEQAPVYSATVTPGVQRSEADANRIEPRETLDSDGYKIWLDNTLIYIFGDKKDKQTAVDKASAAVTFTGQYQILLTRRNSGVYVSVLTAGGLPAAVSVAEDILWTLKENML